MQRCRKRISKTQTQFNNKIVDYYQKELKKQAKNRLEDAEREVKLKSNLIIKFKQFLNLSLQNKFKTISIRLT